MNEKKCSKVITIAFLVALGVAIILMTSVLNGCPQISIREKSESAGFNGSFEIEKSGLPVNWYIYYPPVKGGDTEISLDTADAVEGKQSLRFVVHRVEETGRSQAAGLFQVTAAESKHTYKVSFWLKNRGCRINLMIESEKPKARNRNRRLLGEAETGRDTWRQFEYIYTVPETYNNIRFELDILKPGTLWIDDVRIEEVQTN